MPFRRLILLIVFGMLGGGVVSSAQGRALVEGVSFTVRSDGQGYVLRVQSTARIEAYSMPKRTGQQLAWTLYNTALSPSFERTDPQGPVTRYELVEHGGHLTLRLYLAEGTTAQATAYRDRASDDLLLGLTTDAPPVAEVSPQEANPEAPSNVASPPVQTVADAPGASTATSRARWRLDTVVIDAGHGGKDPGTHGHGVQEKNVVLDVALQLGEYLTEKLGLNVVYTRKTDRFISLKERGHIANEAGGKLFISIHANSAPVEAAYGTETYFLGMHKTEDAREVMQRENRVVKLEENPEQYQALDEEMLVRYALTQSAYMRQSQQLAGLVEEQFAERVHRHSRGVKQAGFQVLWEASMPAILVELGFLTNPRDARFLSSEQGKVYMASALFRAVRAYKEKYEKGINLARKE